MPYKEFSRKSLLVQHRMMREKTATRLTAPVEKENPWFDQFKQIRAMALCTEREIQTDVVTPAELQKLQAEMVSSELKKDHMEETKKKA